MYTRCWKEGRAKYEGWGKSAGAVSPKKSRRNYTVEDFVAELDELRKQVEGEMAKRKATGGKLARIKAALGLATASKKELVRHARPTMRR